MLLEHEKRREGLMEGVAVHRVMQADNRFFMRSVDNQQLESRLTRSAQTTLELREKNGDVAVIRESSRPDPPGGGCRLVPQMTGRVPVHCG